MAREKNTVNLEPAEGSVNLEQASIKSLSRRCLSEEVAMFSLSRILLVPAIALGVSAPAFAQSKADAGSGPTSGAVSTNDAGSGPTKGAKPNTGSTVTPGMSEGSFGRAMTAAPQNSGVGPPMGENQKPKGKVGP